ncbi:O-antigen ligase [Moritella sp. Urea-trap-13]|uniref:O-antigen ligase family protein n=1 Tax=Moritella sp. Urea-trap-13 TaxID=2058327 RepID=UPI000C32F30A|nr:O-antigen ligase family protein [Moritella sp. Urea-trap-13]PKH05366.1 O-antigen ligase domain-containing protein [Moritella sp. Urea-trap-13]
MTDKLLKILILMPFIWTFTGLLLLRNGDKLMIVAIMISIIATLLSYGFDSIKKNIHDKGLWIVLVVTGYTAFSYYYHGASSREIRALVGVLLLLLTFPRELINTHVLKWLLFFGSIFLFLSSYYFSVYLHLIRGAWPINAIPHGTMGATIAILALVCLLNERESRNKIILACALLISISGLVMNPTRGIWLALLIAAFVILSPKIKMFSWKYSLIFIAIFAFALYVEKPRIEQHVMTVTQSEIKDIKVGNFNNSIGVRLQLWMAAAKNTAVNPILGSGDGHQKLLEKLSLEGDVISVVTMFSHYHNQFLDRLVKGGIVGLMLLLTIFIYPFYSTSAGIYRQIAIAVVTVYAVAGLTDVPLNHGAPLFMYLLLMFTLKNHNEASC